MVSGAPRSPTRSSPPRLDHTPPHANTSTTVTGTKNPPSPSTHYVNPLFHHASPPPSAIKPSASAKKQQQAANNTTVDEDIYNYSYLYDDPPAANKNTTKRTSTSASKVKKTNTMEKAQLRLLQGDFEDSMGRTRGAWQTSLRR